MLSDHLVHSCQKKDKSGGFLFGWSSATVGSSALHVSQLEK